MGMLALRLTDSILVANSCVCAAMFELVLHFLMRLLTHLMSVLVQACQAGQYFSLCLAGMRPMSSSCSKHCERPWQSRAQPHLQARCPRQ